MPDTIVELAYLESTDPALDICIRRLSERGIRQIRVLPLFLALGKHLRSDIPAIAAKIALDYPGLAVEFLPALGEAPEFADAMERIALRVART